MATSLVYPSFGLPPRIDSEDASPSETTATAFEVASVPSSPLIHVNHSIHFARHYLPGYHRARFTRHLGLYRFQHPADDTRSECGNEHESGGRSTRGPDSEPLEERSDGEEDVYDEKTPTQALLYPFDSRSPPASKATKGGWLAIPTRHRLRISSAPSSSTPTTASSRAHSTRPRLSRLHIPTSNTAALGAISPAHPHPHRYIHALLHPTLAISPSVRRPKTLAEDLDMDFCCRGEDPPLSPPISSVAAAGAVSELELEPGLLSGSGSGSEDSDESSSSCSPVTPDEATPTATMFSKKVMLYA